MAALNKENGRLCMKFAEARCIAVDALKDAKTTRELKAALYKVIIVLGYKGIHGDLKSVGIKRPCPRSGS